MRSSRAIHMCAWQRCRVIDQVQSSRPLQAQLLMHAGDSRCVLHCRTMASTGHLGVQPTAPAIASEHQWC